LEEVEVQEIVPDQLLIELKQQEDNNNQIKVQDNSKRITREEEIKS
jgi:hypothetical protein